MNVYIVWRKTTAHLADSDYESASVEVRYPVREIVGVFAREVTARCVVAGRGDLDERLEVEECEVLP